MLQSSPSLHTAHLLVSVLIPTARSFSDESRARLWPMCSTTPSRVIWLLKVSCSTGKILDLDLFPGNLPVRLGAPWISYQEPSHHGCVPYCSSSKDKTQRKCKGNCPLMCQRQGRWLYAFPTYFCWSGNFIPFVTLSEQGGYWLKEWVNKGIIFVRYSNGSTMDWLQLTPYLQYFS